MTRQNNEIEFYLNSIYEILSFYDDDLDDLTDQEYLQLISAIQTLLANDHDIFTQIKCLVDLRNAISKANEVGINVDRYDIVTNNACEKIAEIVSAAIERQKL